MWVFDAFWVHLGCGGRSSSTFTLQHVAAQVSSLNTLDGFVQVIGLPDMVYSWAVSGVFSKLWEMHSRKKKLSIPFLPHPFWGISLMSEFLTPASCCVVVSTCLFKIDFATWEFPAVPYRFWILGIPTSGGKKHWGFYRDYVDWLLWVILTS